MHYLTLTGRDAASARSAAEAKARGCDMTSTTHWWGWEESEDASCLLIPEDWEDGLNDDERAALTSDPPDWLAERQAAAIALAAGARESLPKT